MVDHAAGRGGAGGGGAMSRLRYAPAGARGMAVGGAFGAVADDAFGAYWNPAGIVETARAQTGFSHVEWLEGISYEHVSAVVPLGRGRITSLPLLVDDFDDGADPNALGGPIGAWSDQDAGGSSILTTGYRAERRGRSYRVTYLVQPRPDGKPGAAGWWIGMEGRNVKSYRFLAFRIRGAYGGETVTIGLKDKKQVETRVALSAYGGVTASWREVLIPLADFKNVDLTQLDNISLAFAGSGAVYLDDLMFSGKRSSVHGLGVSAGYLTSGKIPRTVEIAAFPFYQEVGSFDVGASVLGVTYGRGFLLGPVYMPAGFTLKYIGENLAEEHASGYALDVGLLLSPADSRRFRFGVSIQNIGSMKAFVQEADPLPLNVKTSFLLKSDSGRTLFSADMDLPVDEEPRFRLGIESWLFRFFSLRAGYAFGEKGEGLRGAAAGLGVQLGGVVIDYAFTPWGDLGDAHRFSATLVWGQAR